MPTEEEIQESERLLKTVFPDQAPFPWATSSEIAIPFPKGTEMMRPGDDITQGGVKKDEGKLRWSLLPWDAVREVVKVLMFGAKKYDDRNWEKGMDWGRLFDASMRHRIDWWQDRQDKATDSDIHHLAHDACDILFLLAYALRNKGKDDRPDVKR